MRFHEIAGRPLLCVLVASSWLFSTRVSAADLEKFFYIGEVKLTSSDGVPIGAQVILFEKTHDPSNSLMIESAVVVQPDGKVQEHTMRLKVKGDSFTLSDDTKTIDGSGTLFGQPWKWTYFKATYKVENGIQIEDENFMADNSMITARKKVSSPDGKTLMYMEMSLKEITPNTFEILKAGLTKKSTAKD